MNEERLGELLEALTQKTLELTDALELQSRVMVKQNARIRQLEMEIALIVGGRMRVCEC